MANGQSIMTKLWCRKRSSRWCRQSWDQLLGVPATTVQTKPLHLALANPNSEHPSPCNTWTKQAVPTPSLLHQHSREPTPSQAGGNQSYKPTPMHEPEEVVCLNALISPSTTRISPTETQLVNYQPQHDNLRRQGM